MAQPDPPHSHPAEQISYVAIGECDVYIGDRPVQHLKTGDIFAVPSNVPHTVKSTTKQLRLVDSFTRSAQDFIRKIIPDYGECGGAPLRQESRRFA